MKRGQTISRYILKGWENGHHADPPLHILQDTSFSEALPFEVDVEHKHFPTRYDMGTYLYTKLSPIDQQLLLHDMGPWTWLALFYFDQLCPPDQAGIRRPREDYNYILSKDFRHRERHAIRTTYMFVKQYKEMVRFMFSKALHERGEIIEQLSQRRDFLTSRGIIEASYFAIWWPSQENL